MRLRLADWRVKARFKRHADMEANRAGTIDWNRSHKEATITVLDPTNHPEEMDFPKPVEETIVHELLHIHLAGFSFEEGTSEHLEIEQAIVAISQALVTLEREARVDQDFAIKVETVLGVSCGRCGKPISWEGARVLAEDGKPWHVECWNGRPTGMKKEKRHDHEQEQQVGRAYSGEMPYPVVGEQ